MKLSNLLGLVACLMTVTPLVGQAVADSQNPLLVALNNRAQIANDVGSNSTDATKALAALHAAKNPSGFSIDADADFAFAAIDVGHRLIVLHKPVEAEAFFQAAEASLTAVIGRTPDSSPKDKAQYLEVRALIRVEFLNKLADGRSDYDAALKLSPGNQRLQQMRQQLSADPTATLQNHQELPAKG